MTAVLVPEDDNPHDAAAVRVDIVGLTVGWLPRGSAASARVAVAAARHAGRPLTARARLTGGWDRGPFGRGHLGVVLDVAPGFPPSDRTEAFIPTGRRVPVIVDPSGQSALRALLDHGVRRVVATLEEAPRDRGAPTIVVRVQGATRGRLDLGSSTSHLPLVRSLCAAGLPASCWAALVERPTDIGLVCSLADPAALLVW